MPQINALVLVECTHLGPNAGGEGGVMIERSGATGNMRHESERLRPHLSKSPAIHDGRNCKRSAALQKRITSGP